MPKKRFNIWMDSSLIDEIKREAKRVHLNHLSTYVRVAALEKMRRDQREEDKPRETDGSGRISERD